MSNKSFALSELILAVAILALALTGILALFANVMILNTTNREVTLAYSAAQSKMEELKNLAAYDFNGLDAYNGQTFVLSNFPPDIPAKARITVSDQVAGELKQVKIDACFMVRNKQIGDNIDLCQSSPVELSTLMAAP